MGVQAPRVVFPAADRAEIAAAMGIFSSGMRVAVTGGCGFIGSPVVDQLAAAGPDVVVLDQQAARP